MYETPECIKQEFQSILDSNDGTYERWLAFGSKLLCQNHLQQLFDAEELLHILYLKFQTGEKKWDKEKYPDFKIYIFMGIKSTVLNLKHKKENQHHSLEPLLGGIGTFETLSEACAQQLKEYCLYQLRDDEECRLVFECICDELQSKEIAERLQKPVKSIESTKRRIYRRLDTSYEDWIEYRNNQQVFVKLQNENDEEEA